MHVKVKLYAMLRRYAGDGQAGSPTDVELPEGATLQALLELLRIPPREARITFVNGIIEELDCSLKDGDEVGMFPPIGGG